MVFQTPWRAAHTHAAAAMSCRMIDHHIGVDLHACISATPDHVTKLGFGSAATDQIITHRLVTGPPLVQRNMLVRRRNLDRIIPFRTKEILALLGNIIPFPLKEMYKDLACGRPWRRRSIFRFALG